MKQIKYEIKHEKRLSNDMIIDIISAKRLLDKAYLHYSAKIPGFIQNISIDPFGYILLSDIQVSFINKK